METLEFVGYIVAFVLSIIAFLAVCQLFEIRSLLQKLVNTSHLNLDELKKTGGSK